MPPPLRRIGKGLRENIFPAFCAGSARNTMARSSLMTGSISEASALLDLGHNEPQDSVASYKCFAVSLIAALADHF